MLYYFSICASSTFIAFPNTGCTSSGAISVKGRITKSRSAIKGWGEVECCSGRRSNRKYQIIIKQQVYINQPVAIYATDRLMRTSQFPFDLLRLLQYFQRRQFRFYTRRRIQETMLRIESPRGSDVKSRQGNDFPYLLLYLCTAVRRFRSLSPRLVPRLIYTFAITGLFYLKLPLPVQRNKELYFATFRADV